ncbi:MAG: tetratricopeptide repeat protein [Candidatus Sericytochromatia bacterium]|nr:tetratricopeptide repeat protein [Candidatus Sericytochromatia bacterium]
MNSFLVSALTLLIIYYLTLRLKRNQDAQKKSKMIYLQGLAFLEAQDEEWAIDCFSKALQFSKQADFYCSRGICYLHLERFEEAKHDFLATLLKQRNTPEAYAGLAEIQAHFGENETALEFMHQALELSAYRRGETDLSHFYVQRGIIYLSLRQTASAQADFEMSLLVNRENSQAYLGLGHSLLAEHNAEKAIHMFQRFHAAEPEKSEYIYAGLGRVLTSLQHFQEARQNLVAAFKSNHHNQMLYLLLAWVYLFTDEIDLSIEACEIVLNLEPEASYAHLNLALAHMLKNNLDLAYFYFEKYQKTYPNHLYLILKRIETLNSFGLKSPASEKVVNWLINY